MPCVEIVTIRSVWPSGAALAAASAAMLPPAPGRFSILTCCPSDLVNCSAITRARMSVACPGGNPTRMRIGFDGHACACAGSANATGEARINLRENFIASPHWTASVLVRHEGAYHQWRKVPPGE